MSVPWFTRYVIVQPSLISWEKPLACIYKSRNYTASTYSNNTAASLSHWTYFAIMFLTNFPWTHVPYSKHTYPQERESFFFFLTKCVFHPTSMVQKQQIQATIGNKKIKKKNFKTSLERTTPCSNIGGVDIPYSFAFAVSHFDSDLPGLRLRGAPLYIWSMFEGPPFLLRVTHPLPPICLILCLADRFHTHEPICAGFGFWLSKFFFALKMSTLKAYAPLLW